MKIVHDHFWCFLFLVIVRPSLLCLFTRQRSFHGVSFSQAVIMDTGSFLDLLELEDRPDLPKHKTVKLSDKKKQGLVDDGSLVSFTVNLTGQQKQDVLYSTLLAQLAANKKHNRFDDPKPWYEFYTNVMGNLGWTMQNFHFDEYKSHQVGFKISQVTLELLSAIIGGEAELLAVVKETLDNLAKSPEGITLFGSSSSSGKSGNFQILPCTLDKSNQISVAFLGSYFKADHVAKDYFFVTYQKQDIHLFKSTHVLTLNEDHYSKVREKVIKKLGDKVDRYIDDLDI